MLHEIDIHSRELVLDGRSFGTAGPYEQVHGSALFRLDPELAVNERIVDLDLAPRDDDGLVCCRADLWLLYPVEPARGNGALFYHVVNRGRKGMMSTFQLAAGSNRPLARTEFGDGLLMEHGFAIAAVGWQADVPPHGPEDPDLLTLDVPVLSGVTGPVACEIVVDERTDLHSLGSRYHDPIEPVEEAMGNARLTVRSEPYGEPEPLQADSWSFDRLPDGRAAIRFPATFEPGRIYNLVYTGRDPRVMGLGFATTRDLVSFLKHETDTTAEQPNPVAGRIDRAHAFGSSQSGRFLRHLLHQGFNEDEAGRPVFDGLFVNVAGAGLGSFNHRFAQPSRHSSAHVDVYYPTEQFPFNDDRQTDPVLEESAGLLDLSRVTETTPKVFYTNTSTEYWNRGASLIHTSIDGETDIEPPPCVRIYHFSSTQHGPAGLPDTGMSLPGNPVDFHLGFRALAIALDDWVRDGTEPPPSAYSTIATNTLAKPDGSDVGWRQLPGLPLPRHPRRPRRLDWGSRWSQGIIDREPPGLGDFFPIRLPRVDEDGNEIAGIRMPEIEVPLGTFTGWRFRTQEMGAPWALAGLQGVWLPFACSQTDADAAGDPRSPLAARYRDVDDYVARCLVAAQSLVDRRLLLARDLELIAERAKSMYTWVTAS